MVLYHAFPAALILEGSSYKTLSNTESIKNALLERNYRNAENIITILTVNDKSTGKRNIELKQYGDNNLVVTCTIDFNFIL
jgi:hypothetical protein